MGIIQFLVPKAIAHFLFLNTLFISLPCLDALLHKSILWRKAYKSEFMIHDSLQSSTSQHESTTKKIFDSISHREQLAGGAGASTSYQGLLNINKVWTDLKHGSWRYPPKEIVVDKQGYRLNQGHDYDVTICGGTLGIFYAAALQRKGLKVAVIERNKVAGREQEWNISKKELLTLIKLGIIREEDLKDVIGIEFNPVRIGFHSDISNSSTDVGFEVYVQDILNLGVKPDRLISLAKDSFLQEGGHILENTALNKVIIYDDVAQVQYNSQGENSTVSLTTKLVIDAMGGSSMIMRQLRGPVAPDGVCVVVGTCASGFPTHNNTYSDLIYTNTPIIRTKLSSVPVQYFWEAFPAGSGPADRTSYMFTYMDAQPARPDILDIMEDYWELLPRYQGASIEELKFLRVLYGMFPVYRNSPLQTDIARILPVGDASGVQSPLSFGGFGSLTRHIDRIVLAVTEAVSNDLLDARDLRKINFYMPNLSAYWMFQRAMSVPLEKPLASPLSILYTLRNSFSAMEKLGEKVMRPFLQDVLQFLPLLRTLLLAAKQDPWTPFKVVPHVGLKELVLFVYHFTWVGIYTLFSLYLSGRVTWLADQAWTPRRARFNLHRLVESWKFGSGLDFDDHHHITL